MKKIIYILYLVFAGYIYCTELECQAEKDQTKCSSHAIEYEGFSCFKFSNVALKQKGCYDFPVNTKNQISFFNITNGISKELSSGFVDYDESLMDGNEMNILILEKVISNQNEEASINSRDLTQDEKAMIKSKNTCSYNSYGRVFNDINNKNIKKFQNIDNKNICFNSQQFPELRDLVDCGYADIKMIMPGLVDEKNREYHLKTCFFIPNDNLPNEL